MRLLHSLSVIPARASREARPDSWRTQAPWFGAAAVVGFAVPFLGSSILELQHDVYLAIYFAAVLALFAAYVRSTRLDVWTTLTRHWKLGSLLGVVFGVLLVRNVLSEAEAPQPDGAYFVFEIPGAACFRHALDSRNLTLVRAAAAELPTVNQEDALRVASCCGTRTRPGTSGPSSAGWGGSASSGRGLLWKS